MQKYSNVLMLTALSLGLNFSAYSSEYEGAPNIEQRVNQFTGFQAYQSLLNIEKSVGYDGATQVQPWSGNYWPLYQGQIGYAYAAREPKHRKKLAPYLRRFKDRMGDIQNKLKRDRLNKSDLEKLSPSEKYDLYLGDHSFTLTNAIWHSLEEADGGRDRKTKIKDWEGICHGWAAASAYSKRPTHKTIVTSLDGKFSIPFYPDDLKALSTLLWANSLVQDQTIMEGLRCNTKGVERDYGTGKIVTTRCKGVNPGVFHLSLTGLVGQKHMPFIINKNNDEEIWNQPVSSYHYKFYNVQTGAEGSLQQTALPIQAADDQFTKFRPQGTKYLVGVEMQLNYSSEVDPSHQDRDEVKHDSIEKLSLKYDLELDSAYHVLGGEWIDASSVHEAGRPDFPGFMWRFKYDYPFASSIVDQKTPEPNTSNYNPSVLIQLSKEASAFRYNRYVIDDSGDFDKTVFDENGKPVLSYKELRPQPIAKVVNYLVGLSNQ